MSDNKGLKQLGGKRARMWNISKPRAMASKVQIPLRTQVNSLTQRCWQSPSSAHSLAGTVIRRAASECAVFAILRLAFPSFDGEMMAKLLQQNECAAWRESPGLLSCAARARLSTAWRCNGRRNSANWRQVLRPTKISRPWLFKAGRFGGVSASDLRGLPGAQQL